MASVRNAVESVDDRAVKAFIKVKEDIKHLKAELLDLRRKASVLDETTQNQLYSIHNLNLGGFVKETEGNVESLTKQVSQIEEELRSSKLTSGSLKDDVAYNTRESAKLFKKVEKLQDESKQNKAEMREVKKNLNRKVLDELSVYNKEYTEIRKENSKLRRDVDMDHENIIKIRDILKEKLMQRDQEVRELRKELLEKERELYREIRELRKELGKSSSEKTEQVVTRTTKKSSKKKTTKKEEKDVGTRIEEFEEEGKKKKSFLKWIVAKDDELDSIEEVK